MPVGFLRSIYSTRSAAVLAAALTLVSTPVFAGPIIFDTWLEFGFTDTATSATGCDPADPAGAFCTPSSGTPTTFLDAPPWTFVGPARLAVTDAFESGDRFRVFDFGVSIGLTSASAPGVDCGDDPVVCIATAGMSQRFLSLGGGPHSLTIIPTDSPGGGGSGYLLASVPEPTTVLLLISGGALAARRRWRSTRA